MDRICDWCRLPIGFFEAQTSNSTAAWHTCCRNEANAITAAARAEFDDDYGPGPCPLPDELAKSETGVQPVGGITTMAAQANRAPREVVDFPANAPVRVALQYAQGKTISNQYGERIMFSLVDGRVMFLDLEVAGQIATLGINVRENFTIMRKWDGQKGSAVSWEVARVPGEQPNGTLVLADGVAGRTGAVAPKAPASSAASAGSGHRTAGSLLIEEANALVDTYAQILERTLTTYQGRIKPEEARSLLVTAYIQRGKFSSVA